MKKSAKWGMAGGGYGCNTINDIPIVTHTIWHRRMRNNDKTYKLRKEVLEKSRKKSNLFINYFLCFVC